MLAVLEPIIINILTLLFRKVKAFNQIIPPTYQIIMVKIG